MRCIYAGTGRFFPSFCNVQSPSQEAEGRAARRGREAKGRWDPPRSCFSHAVWRSNHAAGGSDDAAAADSCPPSEPQDNTAITHTYILLKRNYRYESNRAPQASWWDPFTLSEVTEDSRKLLLNVGYYQSTFSIFEIKTENTSEY